MVSYEEGNKSEEKLGFDETELRLGLGCRGDKNIGNNNNNYYGKRGYEEIISVDLKLNFAAKEMISGLNDDDDGQSDSGRKINLHGDSVKPPAKAQVVGWPPVGSFRKNIMAVQKGGDSKEVDTSGGGGTPTATAAAATAFVKVSMEGAPYLRKVDLKMYNTYQDLSDALGKMFVSFTKGKYDHTRLDLLENSDYVPTYEDKDGDWMLVGDVPWEMFVDSCKRLRIMKGTEAKGLAPRAMEKYKSRS